MRKDLAAIDTCALFCRDTTRLQQIRLTFRRPLGLVACVLGPTQKCSRVLRCQRCWYRKLGGVAIQTNEHRKADCD